MTKRIVINFLSAFLFVSGSAFAQTGKPLYTAPLGVEAYTFRKSFPVSVTKTLDTIKMLGFTEMESGSEGIAPETFRKLCDERGIYITSLGVAYDQLANSTDSIARMAKILGAKYIMCAWIPHKGGVFTYEDAKSAVAVFNKAGKILSDSGLIFCYHPHGYEFQPYENGNLLDYLIINSNPDQVSFEMDIFWILFGGGDPVALLHKYGHRWKLMHLKDMRKGTVKDLTGGTSVENDVPLGTGELDIPAILKEAKILGIEHYYVEDESNYVSKHVPLSIAYLQSLTE
jgi:sugar phosphate isomerase/epimerase